MPGYIFLNLQHFATKLGYSTNFEMLFRGVIKYFVIRLDQNLVYNTNCPLPMGDRDNGPFYMKFEKIQNGQKYHHSLKEHPMFNKIAKFGCEML